HGLAAETRGRRQARRLVEQVVLALLRRRELLEPLLHDDVAGRAGAVPAAGVLQEDAVAEEDVENRAWTAVVLEGRLARVELDHPLGLAGFVQDADFRHRPSLASRPEWCDLSQAAPAG